MFQRGRGNDAVLKYMQFCSSSEIQPFDAVVKQAAITNADRVEIAPKNAINDNCIEFLIPKSPDYTDLSKTLLAVRFKIVAGNSTSSDPPAVAATEKVGPINNILHSLFSQVDVRINNSLVSSTDNLYPYRAYLENLLSYGNEAKAEQLWYDGWVQDSAENMDQSDPLAVATAATATTAAIVPNLGLKARHSRQAGKSITYIGRLHSDIFHQDKLILDGCDIDIKLIRNKAPFALMSSTASANYKIFIEKATLLVWRKKIQPDIMAIVAKTLEHRSAQYNLKRIDMKTFTIPANTRSHNLTLYRGKLPSLLILGFVTNSSFNGSYTENPFNFQHFGLTQLALKVNSHTINAFVFNALDFSNGEYGLAYDSIRTAMHKSFKNCGTGIKPSEYGRGYTLFAFDLTPNDPAGHDGENATGTVDLEVAFSDALESAPTLVCYSESDAIFLLDKNRNCSQLI